MGEIALPNHLELASRVSVFVFVVSSMFSMGLNLTTQQILESIKSTRLVLAALVANFVLVPLSAYLITRAIPLEQPFAIGILLVATASGAPIFPKLVEYARGDIALAVGLMALLMAATIVYMPVVVPLILPGVHTAPWAVAKPLLVVVLPSLVSGLCLRTYRRNLAERLQPILRVTANAALVLVIIAGLAANGPNVMRAGSFKAVVACLLLLLISFSFGFGLGGPHANTRKVLALGTAQRNLSVAFLIAVENFREPGVVTMLAILALLAFFTQIPIALALGRRTNRLDASSQ
jgi:bile acid:Na+ symporter, BASS family